MELLCEYDFVIKHIKGKENKVGDALSRNIQVMHVETICIGTLDLKDKTLNPMVHLNTISK